MKRQDEPFVAAVVQAAPAGFDASATLRIVEAWTRRAREARASVVVFPEAFVGSFPAGLDFGTRIGLRTPAGRAAFQRFHEAAIEVPGPETGRLGEIAAASGCYLVIGVVERAGGTLYSSTVFLSPSGSLLGRHRKVMCTGVERYVWGMGDGSTLSAVETPLGRIGAVLGCENYMPPLRMAMYGKGINLYCAPTADDSDVWLSSMRTVAMEGRCFVLSANQVLRRSDFPVDYPMAPDVTPETILLHGGSCIISPVGVVLAESPRDQECLLTARIDLSEITRGKYDFDVVGHYSRSDIFRLAVDEGVRQAVTGISPAHSSEETSLER